MHGYGQFCPIAKTMEVLDERWTVLIVRELLCGSHHFNELRRGVPRMSPALLSKRLRDLTRVGIVERQEIGGRVRYELTPGGQELAPVIMALGEWGARWMTQLGDEDLDPHLLMWDVRRNVVLGALPDERTVVNFHFTDVPVRGQNRWWLVVQAGEVELCDFDPGFAAAVSVICPLRTMVRVWRGDISWAQAQRDHDLRLEGSATARAALPGWLSLSTFAGVARPTLPTA
ncbi:helix-turn-helix transcriptional regulator [Ornithinimicrobium faecis]|uniref:Helix-turn-helix transcriptional regulator n=1 Tax=Ornithinimicrobium faecis TaxID=2934158 RepID=A0ABY4YZG8_9MICO|nr:helix-turn-helix domain-containing protein [Ornithinimicrobium sp. HY1793]USQ81919.1 helix-turn-helix transcriptional regulator [Ornithinimicrobium sp. HY1793]